MIVPDAAMPSPMPVKMPPLAKPRRDGGTCARIVGAASTISAPPDNPEANRQTKNHGNDTGSAQATNASVASSIIARMTALRSEIRARQSNR
ncbi:hypothetical protein GQ56_0104340 [Burkholderia paludis]|nr:hypothetical protein GQ56_0104340 [Burkholderia paludis]